jgi:hypothetical protein
VIDAYARIAIVGIELLTVDARVVIASVDTYLRFAEAVNRLDIEPKDQVAGVPGLMREVTEGGAKHKTKGALDGVKETAQEAISNFLGGDDDRRAPSGREAPRRSSRRGEEE